MEILKILKTHNLTGIVQVLVSRRLLSDKCGHTHARVTAADLRRKAWLESKANSPQPLSYFKLRKSSDQPSAVQFYQLELDAAYMRNCSERLRPYQLLVKEDSHGRHGDSS